MPKFIAQSTGIGFIGRVNERRYKGHMRRGAANLPGLSAALLLALLTGAVFWVLRDYGPESALRKFHRAAVNGNYRELARVVTPNTYASNLNTLVNMIAGYARNGARYQLKRVDRREKHVLAEVAYVYPDRPMQPHVLWVVERVEGGWRVNVNATIEVGQMMYGS